MENALRSLRRLSEGTGDEGAAFKAAAGVALALAQADLPDIDACSDVDPQEGQEQVAPATDGAEVVELYSWGRSSTYQLGFGIAGQEQPVPRIAQFPGGTSLRTIVCGAYHTVALTTTGSLFVWGVNGGSGRLGVEPAADGQPPRVLVEPFVLPEFGPDRHFASKVAVGMAHTVVMTSAGKLLAWGSNASGQAGVQGAATGEGAQCRRPQLVKPFWKTDAAVDIAAGAAHSLCATASGSVFVWGSNALGALGLGAPPAGPVETSTPQQLPHLRGVAAVFAAPSKNLSVALAAHGDAIVFGMAAPDARGGKAAIDGRFFSPTRVRRRASAAGDVDDWQQQRAQGAGASVRSVVFGATEALAVDVAGALWSWPLCTPRPCCAELLLLLPPPSPAAAPRSKALPAVASAPRAVRSLAAADRSDAAWAVDGSQGCLWRLQRGPAGWHAERYEQLAQVSEVVCSGAYQSALVIHRRPADVSPPLASLAGGPTAERQDDEDDHDSEGGDPQTLPGSVVASSPMPTLQQLCEDKLCRMLSPKTFGMVCELSWELNRPEMLDRAFSFLRANGALMFSRQYLPTLSQLPFEVLVAFEMTLAGRLPKPSEALEAFFAGDFPPKEWLSESAEAQQAWSTPELTVSPLGGVPQTPPKQAQQQPQQRRRRRGAAGTITSPALRSEAGSSLPGTPLCGPSSTSGGGAFELLPPPACSDDADDKMRRGTSGNDADNDAIGRLLCTTVLPVARAAQDWVEVRGRRKAVLPPTPALGKLGGSDAKASPPVRELQVQQQQARDPSTPEAKPAPVPSQTFALADFVRAKPDAKAAAAKKAAQGDGAEVEEQKTRSTWASRPERVEAANLRDVLAEQETGKPRPRKGGAPVATEDETKCCWGYDAMPSERPKGKSVYELQRLDEQEKVDEEIREIEAMFAALAVAELAETEVAPSPPAAEPEERQEEPAKGWRGRGGDASSAWWSASKAWWGGWDGAWQASGRRWSGDAGDDAWRKKGPRSGATGDARWAAAKRGSRGPSDADGQRWAPKGEAAVGQLEG